jgi:lipopolysaccharide transport system ATP-binding protein
MKSHQAMKAKISSNKTVVLVSHSMEAIRDLCDRVLWLHEGQSVMCGDANQVVDAYLHAIRVAVRDIQKMEREERLRNSAQVSQAQDQ